MLADPCTDPGIFARGVQARLPENSSDVFFLFCPHFLLLSRRAQPFPGGIKLFSGGGGGGGVEMGSPNANYRNP